MSQTEACCKKRWKRTRSKRTARGREEQVLCTGKRDEGVVRKKKKATVERLFHLEMKGADGERAISKGNIITFSYLLLEHSGGGRGEEIRAAGGGGGRKMEAQRSI